MFEINGITVLLSNDDRPYDYLIRFLSESYNMINFNFSEGLLKSTSPIMSVNVNDVNYKKLISENLFRIEFLSVTIETKKIYHKEVLKYLRSLNLPVFVFIPEVHTLDVLPRIEGLYNFIYGIDKNNDVFPVRKRKVNSSGVYIPDIVEGEDMYYYTNYITEEKFLLHHYKTQFIRDKIIDILIDEDDKQ
jgi:hypothetical protein